MSETPNINNEIQSLKSTVAPVIDWLKEPYIGLVQVKELKLSENVANYTGKPFFKFLLKTSDGRQANIIFWREIFGDDAKKNEEKRNKLKKFIDNCEPDDTKDGLEWISSVIGKKLNVVLKKREYVITGAPGKPPRIDTDIVYSYSAKREEVIEIQNLSQLHINLSDADRKAFDEACKAFNDAEPVEQKKDALDEAKGAAFKNNTPEAEDF
jgi:hypothetical protein